jgi:hypothetical protein
MPSPSGNYACAPPFSELFVSPAIPQPQRRMSAGIIQSRKVPAILYQKLNRPSRRHAASTPASNPPWPTFTDDFLPYGPSQPTHEIASRPQRSFPNLKSQFNASPLSIPKRSPRKAPAWPCGASPKNHTLATQPPTHNLRPSQKQDQNKRSAFSVFRAPATLNSPPTPSPINKYNTSIS